MFFFHSFFLTDVLYIPKFTFNLISISKLTTCLPCNLIFMNTKCEIQDIPSLKMIGVADLLGGLYAVNCPAVGVEAFKSVNVISSSSTSLWQMRLGHPSFSRISSLKNKHPYIQCLVDNNPCYACHLAKHKKFPFPHSNTESVNPFDLIHVDIWGPISFPLTSSHRDFFTVVDDKTQFTWLFFMKMKSEFGFLIQIFINLVETQLPIR